MANPRISIADVAPPNAKPGVVELVNHVLHCCNAALTLDDQIEAMDMEQLMDAQAHAEQIAHLGNLINTTGPLMAEVEQPLEVVLFVFGSVNQSVVHSYLQRAMMTLAFDPTGKSNQDEIDHAIAILHQVLFEMVALHLEATDFSMLKDDDGS